MTTDQLDTRLAEASGALAERPAADLTWCGAERVELSERFYRGVFVAMLVFVGLAATAALALLPLRDPVGPEAAPTIALAALLAIGVPFAVLRSRALYRALRLSPRWELVIVLLAATLIVYPLHSELWWPSCALLMLVATLAPLARTLAYCLLVLTSNLAAHLIAGTLADGPTVTITGLWVGLVFWPSTIALSADRLASHILRLNSAVPVEEREPPLRVNSSIDATAETSRASAQPVHQPAQPHRGLERLTFRQLQVVALLSDGLLYAQVAEALSISVRQVQRHVSQAVARLDVRSAPELVAVAVAEGLVSPDIDPHVDDDRPEP